MESKKSKLLKSNTALFEKRVYDKAVDYLFKNLPATMVSQTLIPMLVLVILWSSANHLILIIWTIINFIICIFDYLLYLNYKKNRAKIENPQKWGNYYAYDSLVMGIVNGVAVILFFSPDLIGIQVFLMVLILGYSAGAVVMNAYWLLSSYLLATPILVLAAIRFFIEGGIGNIGVSLMLLLYLGSVFSSSKSINKSILETIKIQFENADLSDKYQKQKEITEQASLSKSKFLAAASHDLRQPLHAMGIFTNLLEDKLENDGQRELFDKVSHSLDSLRDLLNTLLDISKLDAGVVEKNIKHFKLNNLLSRLELEFRAEALNKGLGFKYSETNVVVLSDNILLELILRNILSNALRYTENGEVSLKVLYCESNNVKIVISDTGIGIPKDKQQVIFEEFQQLDNPERDRVKGLGLGLSIVNRLVDLLKYNIDVESELGKGTTFTVTVPIGDQNKVIQQRPKKVFDMNVSLNNTPVLIIDDDVVILEGMKKALEVWGCDVIVAESEQQAIKNIEINNFKPEVIISDFRLRGDKTGIQAIESIQNYLGEVIPALIITGDTSPERLREAKLSGHVLLHKPVMPAQVLAFIRRILVQKTEVA